MTGILLSLHNLAAKLRRDFEANVSDNIESILDYLSEVRTLAKEKIDDDRKRAAYIREVSEFCMKADRVCSNKEENAFLQKYLDNRSETVLPGAALVGAGCGLFPPEQSLQPYHPSAQLKEI